jgi:kynurenine formamidase
MSGAPGLSRDAAAFLGDAGCSLVGADQWSIDVMPSSRPEDDFACHVELLVRRGIYIIENLNLSPLAATGQREFLFLAFAPPVIGVSAFPIQPVALVAGDPQVSQT